MAIIYETINLYNKEHGINPWRYIGSDQYNDPEYLGSNKDLKKDILSLGRHLFQKNILEDCGEIDNKQLRYLEATKYLKPNRVRTDQAYYNKSETYSPGCGQKGMTHKKPRSESHRLKIIAHRTGSVKSEESRQKMRDKKIGTKAKESTKLKMSGQRAGENNSNALEWTITTPSGDILTIKGLRAWAKENGHNYYHIYGNTHGWKSIKCGAGRGGKKKKEQQSEN